MRYTVILEERAIQEADEAYKYYEGELAGLGERFKEELQKAILYIQEHPLHFKKIKKEIRQALIHKFPYLIVYEVMDQTIIVYAVFHTSRNPRKKIKS